MWKYQNTDDMYIGRFSDNNELYHYGVLGMKWGHRKSKIKSIISKKIKKHKDKDNLTYKGDKIAGKYTYKRFEQEREESRHEKKKMRVRQVASFGAMYVGQVLKRSAKLTYINSSGKTVPNSTVNYVNAASKIGNALETIGGYSLVGSTIYGQKKQYDVAKKYR